MPELPELGPVLRIPAFGLSLRSMKNRRDQSLRHLPLVTELAALSRNFRLTGHVLKGGNTMRDIRSDLQERATLIDEQIRAAYSHFEKTVEQLKNEHDARVADLKSGITMIAKFMEFEQRYFGSDSPSVESSALVRLADLFMHRLNEVGPMSREVLVDLAVKEGFFADTETAAQGVHPMLVTLLRSGLIRELPNGTFAPPTMSQAIKLRRVV